MNMVWLWSSPGSASSGIDLRRLRDRAPPLHGGHDSLRFGQEDVVWRGGRAAQCTSLENWRPKGLVGSNPTPSASYRTTTYGPCEVAAIVASARGVVPDLYSEGSFLGSYRSARTATTTERRYYEQES